MSRATSEARAILAQVKDAARQPYAWPGGYPKLVIMADGELLCCECARREYRLIARATRLPFNVPDGGWRAAGADINLGIVG